MPDIPSFKPRGRCSTRIDSNMVSTRSTSHQEIACNRKRYTFFQDKRLLLVIFVAPFLALGVNSADSSSDNIFSAKLSSRPEAQPSQPPPPHPTTSKGVSPPEMLLKLAKIRSSSGFNSEPSTSSASNVDTISAPLLARRMGVLPGLELVDVDFGAAGDEKEEASGGIISMKAKKFVFRGNPFLASDVSSPQYSSVSSGGSVAPNGGGGRRRNDKTLSFPVRVVTMNNGEARREEAAINKNYRELKAAKFYAPRNSYQALAGTRIRAGNEIQHNYAAAPLMQATSSDAVQQEGLIQLPECASQQVCAAVHLRFNTSTPLYSCPARFGERCSTSLSADDGHSMGLTSNSLSKPLTLVKTCEPNRVIEPCHNQKDWSLFALQNTRTRKAHYLIICSCPSGKFVEGPIEHAAPDYAQVPGIRIFGMMCVTGPLRKGKHTPLTAKDVEGPSPDLWLRISNFLGHLHSWR